MANRIKHRVFMQTSRDTAGKQKMFWMDSDTSEVITDGYERLTSGDLNIAASATESVPTGDVDAVKGAYLEVSEACNVRINGSLDDIPMVVPTGASQAKLFLEAAISEIEIENTGTTALTGVYCLWGDPTP